MANAQERDAREFQTLRTETDGAIGRLILNRPERLNAIGEDTVMFIPEVDLGVPLAWGAIPRMVREIGPAMTKELVMTCRRFTPQEAKALGFANRVVPADRLEAEAEALARELAAKPSVPIVMTKEHVNAVARAMGAGFTSYADGDLMLSSIREDESKAAAEKYTLASIRKKRDLG